MSFLYPLFLAGALAVALPIALHLLRRDQAPAIPFTAVRMLRSTPVERVHKHRLRDLLLLLARVFALLLLAAAFARPYVQGAVPSAVNVVAIDRSYSMGGDARYARALDAARSAIDETKAGERVALIAFDDRAELLAAPGNAGDARSALAAVRPGYGSTRYESVFEAVRELAGGAAGRVTIVTDRQQSGWEGDATSSLPPSWDVAVHSIDPPSSNLSVTSISIEPERVAVTLDAAGAVPRRSRAKVSLDGREVAAADFTVNASGQTTVSVPWRAPATGALSVSIEDPGGLPADDVRYVVLGSRGKPSVLVIASDAGGLFLSRAIETSRAEQVDVVSASRASSLPAEKVSSYSTIVLLSTRGLERRVRDLLSAHVRAGAGLVVAASPDVDLSVLSTFADWQPPLAAAEHAEQSTLAATDVRHPIFRPFGALTGNLGQVRVDRSWRVEPEGWSVIARFANGLPALLERELGEGRVVLFASDLERRWNDFPLHPSFVPFAIETTRYAAGDRRVDREYTVASAPQGTGPDPGIFRTADNKIVAVNVDLRESRRAVLTPEAFTDRIARSGTESPRAADVQARQAESQQSYWQYGLMIMIAALVAESFVGRS